MKKFFYIILGILGLGLVAYSVTQGWATFFFELQGIKSHPLMGYEFTLGILTAVFGAVAFALLFIKPKIALVPALLSIAMAAWFYMNPPMVDEVQYDPEKMVIGAMVGGLLIGLAGLIAPKKKA